MRRFFNENKIRDLTNYNRIMDQEIALTPMPTEYADKIETIMCNDCRDTSKVKFHILGHKCKSCGSYNTRGI